MTEKKEKKRIRGKRFSKRADRLTEAVASVATKKDVRVGDEVYFIKQRLGCPYCNNSGRKKVYTSLRKLKYHFTFVHDLPSSQLIVGLETLLKKGVLL